jgi:hypothetical protein
MNVNDRSQKRVLVVWEDGMVIKRDDELIARVQGELSGHVTKLEGVKASEEYGLPDGDVFVVSIDGAIPLGRALLDLPMLKPREMAA